MTIEINTKNDIYCFGQEIVNKIGDIETSDKYVELNIRVRGQIVETTKTSACYGCKSSLKFVFTPNFGDIKVKDCPQDFHEYLVENGFKEIN